MDAVILAGALNSGALRTVSQAQYEAEIEIDGQPMIDYVIDALCSVREIKKIVVVGSKSISAKANAKKVLFVQHGTSMVESLFNGLEVLEALEPVLIVTSDIPLITKEALEDFLVRCDKNSADLYYSFVSKTVNEAKYPQVQRTYVRLKEGTFTGGNLVLLTPHVLKDQREILEKAVALRKKPVQLCRLLGWRCFLKLLTGKLTIANIEQRVRTVFDLVVAGIISPYPEVGIDVDKPSDLKLAREVLSKSK